MTAFDLLLSLEWRGVKLRPSHDRLMVDAPAGILTSQDRTMLARHKAGLLALLIVTTNPADLPSEWHERWEERAAIMEYAGGFTPERADFLALVDIIGQIGQT